MAKNKSLEKDKKKKVPFNVLSKKGLMGLALAGVMMVSPFMLAGCSGEQGPKGNDGTNGSTWYSGTEYSASQGVIGDFFYDTDDFNIYQKTADGWTLISNIKGPQGETGPTGPQGPAGQDGQNGQDGATWLTGTVITGTGIGISATITNSKVGDLYFNTTTCDIYQCTAENTWNWIANIKGDKGETGEKGEDGTSVYVGYDGYVWNGAERSAYKVVDDTANNVIDNTIGLINHSKYFDSTEIDMATNQVALMGYYFESIQKTNYSGLTIETMDIYSANAGTLTIGTANVASFVNGRTTGTSVTLNNTQTFTLTAGANSLELNLSVGENETVVLGKSTDTAKLVSYQGISADEEMGEFSSITVGTAQSSSQIKNVTNGIEDKLVIKTSIHMYNELSTISETLSKDLTDTTEYSYSTSLSPCGFFAQDYMSLYPGNTLTKVEFPLYVVPAIDTDQYLTFYVCKGLTLNSAPTSMKEYRVKITTDQLANATLVTEDNYASLGYSNNGHIGKYLVREWITAEEFYDVSADKYVDEITLASDENIAWQKLKDNSVSVMFKKNIDKETLHQLTETGVYNTSVSTTVDLHVNWYLKEDFEYSTYIEELKEENKIAELKAVLSGESVSILGDSISTYSGVSECESPWYGTGGSNTTLLQSETWWQQIIDTYDMKLLVNDSIGGAGVYTAYNQTSPTATSGFLRADNLKTDTENPDYVFVFMGTNDKETLGSFAETIADTALITDNGDGSFTYGTPDSFADACYIMLHKIVNQNPDAKVYYMLSYSARAQSTYNAVIKEFCDYLGITTIDLGETALINYSGNLELVDGASSVHPNANGMDIITDKVVAELREDLLNN